MFTALNKKRNEEQHLESAIFLVESYAHVYSIEMSATFKDTN